jgi:hypothetical protein
MGQPQRPPQHPGDGGRAPGFAGAFAPAPAPRLRARLRATRGRSRHEFALRSPSVPMSVHRRPLGESGRALRYAERPWRGASLRVAAPTSPGL